MNNFETGVFDPYMGIQLVLPHWVSGDIGVMALKRKLYTQSFITEASPSDAIQLGRAITPPQVIQKKENIYGGSNFKIPSKR